MNYFDLSDVKLTEAQLEQLMSGQLVPSGRWCEPTGITFAGFSPAGVDLSRELPGFLADALSRCRDDVLRLDDFIASSGVVPCEIEYADILEEPDGVLAMVQQVLGVEHRPLASSVVKNTNQDLAAAVGNILARQNAPAAGGAVASAEARPVSKAALRPVL